ncbi:hypothetical protein RX327_32405 [Bradyrhizobium sp. BEA-2-5]|uniref:hypothetical protein n=1 Tax=Bradyrhizobium sp. BEA-2-5 TaxID=3080015 RepID=UPI00293ECBE3|nr:hypothetical protein [Bradyrhizobium sp. BEA-2-5]WOH85566.1 hypothetical protein RX327_32405 [Bradyrhizobium sp. BEA-2-5]
MKLRGYAYKAAHVSGLVRWRCDFGHAHSEALAETRFHPFRLKQNRSMSVDGFKPEEIMSVQFL